MKHVERAHLPYAQTICILVLLATSVLEGAVIPGRWEKVEALTPGTPVIVVLKSGERLNARYSRGTDEGLIIDQLDGGRLELPKASVRKVRLNGRKETDPVWNGLLIGASAGVATFLIGHVAAAGAPGAHDLGGALVFGAIGMGVGAAVDAAFTHDETIYHSQ